MYQRNLKLEAKPKNTFFLWGPRQTGKSTLLKTKYGDALLIDLLKTDEFTKYSIAPHLLREELVADKKNKFVIIDEIQKVPALLDEVHWLIENNQNVFSLCGSSARKVKRGHANLLGGRAIRHELFGLTNKELDDDFDLEKIINRGYLPRHYSSDQHRIMMHSYINDYLKEEIISESLVRNLPAFADFLSAASLSDSEAVVFSTFARDCSIDGETVKNYFDILIDTLLGRWLPAYRKRPKRKVIKSPKFYFADVGMVNFLAKRGEIVFGSELFGKAFENWVHHEIVAHCKYQQLLYDVFYWRLTSQIEVDFILGDMEVAIEAKSSKRINQNHLKGLRNLKEDYPKVKHRLVVCLESKRRLTEDGILILPYQDFIDGLWEGEFIR